MVLSEMEMNVTEMQMVELPKREQLQRKEFFVIFVFL